MKHTPLIISLSMSLLLLTACGSSNTNVTPATSDTAANPPLTNTANPPPTNNAPLTPGATVNAFYAAWLTYSGNPLTDHIYSVSPYITASLRQSLDAQAQSPSGLDPVLCAQTKPSALTTSLVSGTDGGLDSIDVTEIFGASTTVVRVGGALEGDVWKINTIECAK